MESKEELKSVGNDEKDIKIKVLVEKMETLENKAKEILENEPIHDNSPELATCEYCDFSTKNERSLKLHIKEMDKITKVEIIVFCRANQNCIENANS